MVNVELKFIYHLPFSIHHLNLIPEFIQKGTHCVPFCIPYLFSILSYLYSKLYRFLQLKAKTSSFIHLRFHLDFATVRLNDVLYDGKP